MSLIRGSFPAARGLAPLALFLPLALLVAGSVAHALGGYAHRDLSGHALGSDDAYISYRYALNLVQGHGLVFNPGERVEGYTNFGYVLLMAGALLFVRPDSIWTASVVVNILFAALALALFGAQLNRERGARIAGLGIWLLALCPPLWAAVASGMETTLVLALQIGLWSTLRSTMQRRTLRSSVTLPLIASLLVLARADGFLFAGLAVAFLVCAGRGREALVLGAATAVTVGTHVLWRLGYYGYPLPNTYYAKVSGPLVERLAAGVGMLSGLVALGGLLPHLSALLVAGLQALRGEAKGVTGRVAAAGPEAFLGLGWLSYWLYVGGDIFQDRFLLVLFPLGAAALLLRLGPLPWASLVGVAALVGVVQLLPLATDGRFHYAYPKYDRWVTLGRFLGQHHPGALLAADAAGKVPYFSGLHTIDMLGLNDVYLSRLEVARFAYGENKVAPEYVLGRSPDLIAAWTTPDGDLYTDLPRSRYEPAGYRLTYLINAGQRSLGADILNVAALDPAHIRSWVEQGYRYAVLARWP